ncbi:MAG TPA: hypothetical protein VLM40_07460 [Gemmata sp.]|nr:hypothetical protein [Gemmata sp.]
MYSPLPIAVLYAGLGGMVLALLIATIQNRWSLRVFFLLALRLAIGWHFLFEGLHKVHSHYSGTERPFSSEPYFRNAPGPIAAYMRKQYEDPLGVIDAKVKQPKPILAADFAKLSIEEQAQACPPEVAKEIDAIVDEPSKKTKKAEEIEKKAAEAEKTDEAKARAKAAADELRAEAAKQVELFESPAGKQMIAAAKAEYARWVYGVDRRVTKLKAIKGDDVSLTAPDRIQYLEWLRKEVKESEDRRAALLGNGEGTEMKHAAEVRTDLITAESDLAHDANAFVAELKKSLNGGKAVEEPSVTRMGDTIDRVTMWMLVAVGACLMAGLFTRIACLVGAAFLVMTYLTYPPFPWYPLPPNTEGNPIFINKNVIECLALLALACMPTGRWLGLDAIVLRPFCRYRGDPPAT